MNRRGIGRAFTLLTAAGIIALVMLLFTLGASVFLTKQSFDVTANVDAASTAGQLRTLVSALADDIARHDCARVPALTQAAFGKAAVAAVSVNGNLACGAAIKQPSARLETLLPAPDNPAKPLKVLVEVKRQ